MNGICLHYWYRFLDKIIGNSMKNKVGVVLKVFADQLVYAPLSILAFFSFAAVLENEKSSDAIDALVVKVKFNFLHTLIADCTMWPLVNAINFRFIPLNYRPSFVGLAQLIWQTYLSTAARLNNEASLSNHSQPSMQEPLSDCVAGQRS
mmetsp:Transcript_9917/g.13570  ORF Transcript_9917/g.13570 Transcript_9917/m.13570 type:complete len:149 (+) Transcript_9917:497-943(+)